MLTDEELEKKIEGIRRICFPPHSDSLRHHNKSLKQITNIIKRATREQLLAHDPNLIITCALKIVVRFDGKLPMVDNMCNWKRRRKLRLAKECYYNLLKAYIPERSEELVKAVMGAIFLERLWKFETLCFEIIFSLLECGAGGVTLVHTIFDKIESRNPNVQDTRAVIRVLYELLDVCTWPESHETVGMIERILSYFYVSITSAKSRDNTLEHKMLKRGLEICVRNVMKNMCNDHLLIVVQHMCSWAIEDEITDDIILEFGSTLEYAAHMHRVTLYEKTLTPKIFSLLMEMIASNSKVINLLGNRVLQYFLERKDNRMFFDTPRIFFENTRFDVKIGECYKEDRLFFKLHREIVHDSLLKSMLNHSDSRMNLEMTYCTICLIAVEVPCGFTAAALVCLAMNIQDLTLKRVKEHCRLACHIHATVIAIMSLICWVHKAEVFYEYVNKIMMERARWAPHLNPPIQSEYRFAVHHVLWEKSELFFVDWQARYGLWKCFRLQEGVDSTTTSKSAQDQE